MCPLSIRNSTWFNSRIISACIWACMDFCISFGYTGYLQLGHAFLSPSFSILKSWISPFISSSSWDTVAVIPSINPSLCSRRRLTSKLSSTCRSWSTFMSVLMAMAGVTKGVLVSQTEFSADFMKSPALSSRILSLSVMYNVYSVSSPIGMNQKKNSSFTLISHSATFTQRGRSFHLTDTVKPVCNDHL